MSRLRSPAEWVGPIGLVTTSARRRSAVGVHRPPPTRQGCGANIVRGTLVVHELEARIHGANGHLAEALVVLDEVERALATAHGAEVKAEREGALIVKAAVVVIGAAAALVVASFFLRWYFHEPEPASDAVAAADASGPLDGTAAPD